MSRPLALLKRLVARVAGETETSRVSRVLKRLASLLFVKRSHSEQLSPSDVVYCSILSDDDVATDGSIEEFTQLLMSVPRTAGPLIGFSLCTNRCGDSKLARASNATRILDTRVNFSTVELDLKLDADEEEVIDPSSDASSTNEVVSSSRFGGSGSSSCGTGGGAGVGVVSRWGKSKKMSFGGAGAGKGRTI